MNKLQNALSPTFYFAILLSLGMLSPTSSLLAGNNQAENLAPQEISRRDTVVFDLDGGPVTDPESWNPFMPGRRLVHGFHQALMEPLFILNYENAEIEPWLPRYPGHCIGLEPDHQTPESRPVGK